MVGLFINTLPILMKVEWEQPMESFCTVGRAEVEARRYEYAPLVKIQSWSELGRGPRCLTAFRIRDLSGGPSD